MFRVATAADIENQVVEGDGGRGEVLEDPDAIVFTPDEVAEQADTTCQAHIPEHPRHRDPLVAT